MISQCLYRIKRNTNLKKNTKFGGKTSLCEPVKRKHFVIRLEFCSSSIQQRSQMVHVSEAFIVPTCLSLELIRNLKAGIITHKAKARSAHT